MNTRRKRLTICEIIILIGISYRCTDRVSTVPEGEDQVYEKTKRTVDGVAELVADVAHMEHVVRHVVVLFLYSTVQLSGHSTIQYSTAATVHSTSE